MSNSHREKRHKHTPKHKTTTLKACLDVSGELRKCGTSNHVEGELKVRGPSNIIQPQSFHKSRAASHADQEVIQGEASPDLCTWATYDGIDIVTMSMVFLKSFSGVDDVLRFDWPVPLNRAARPTFLYSGDQRVRVVEVSDTQYQVTLFESANVPPANALYSVNFQYNVNSPHL